MSELKSLTMRTTYRMIVASILQLFWTIVSLVFSSKNLTGFSNSVVKSPLVINAEIKKNMPFS